MSDARLSAMRIREAMDEMQLSPSDLANRSGINKGTLSHYIHGQYTPSSDNAYRIANALNVSPAWIMGLPVDKFDAEKRMLDLSDLSDEQARRIIAYAEMVRKGEL